MPRRESGRSRHQRSSSRIAVAGQRRDSVIIASTNRPNADAADARHQGFCHGVKLGRGLSAPAPTFSMLKSLADVAARRERAQFHLIRVGEGFSKSGMRM